MVSNPALVMIGEDHRSFHYEAGKYAFHFSPNANGLSNTMECNIMFFADDKKHALKILSDLFAWYINAYKDLAAYNETRQAHHLHDPDEPKRKLEYLTKLSDSLKRGEIRVKQINRNQVFKIGWAYNDTLF